MIIMEGGNALFVISACLSPSAYLCYIVFVTLYLSVLPCRVLTCRFSCPSLFFVLHKRKTIGYSVWQAVTSIYISD